MNSVDFAKLASTYLKLPSQVAATAAEELYAKGIVSYPRTETQVFDESIDLPALVAAHAGHSVWGGIARDMVCPGGKFEKPRAGEKHDGAHPPSAWSVDCRQYLPSAHCLALPRALQFILSEALSGATCLMSSGACTSSSPATSLRAATATLAVAPRR